MASTVAASLTIHLMSTLNRSNMPWCILLLVCFITARASAFRAGFSQDLVAGDSSAAVQTVATQYGLLQPSGTPRIANISTLSDIINAAVVDFGNRSTPGLDQQVYASAFADFLGILGSGHPSNKIAAFANSIASALTAPSGSGGYGGFNTYLGALVELAHLADSDRSFAGAFRQAQSSQQTVQSADSALYQVENHAGPLPARYTLTPDALAAFRPGATSVYGANPHTLPQAKGNTTVLASLLFGSAYLAQGNLALAAQNLSDTILDDALGLPKIQQAYREAIQYAFGSDPGSPSIDAITVLVAAAVSSKQAAVLADSFAQANRVSLQVFCTVAQAAQNLSAAAGQAALSSIPKSFGDQPCDFFQAHGDFLYAHGGSPSRCNSGPPNPGPASLSDCSQAIAKLHANSSQCAVVPVYPYSNENSQVKLAAVGNCTIVLGGPVGSALPCSRVAEYAEQLATACSTAQSTTGGSYNYPEGRSVRSIRPYINVVPPSRYRFSI